jgi:23S rRNA (adenine2503-C2)-methyltransferase
MHAMKFLNEFKFSINSQRKLSHIVFMGQGEPLYNFKEISKAIKIITSPDGLAFPPSKITLSTSGIVPLIEKVGSELGIQLAISLHASTDILR